ncbi:fungal-specific transcription factor domain-containing protein [Penicillium longicatenatum]|nr:fungal-specific transcription factor domain-containing protein [Penicillium longicatenatum]
MSSQSTMGVLNAGYHLHLDIFVPTNMPKHPPAKVACQRCHKRRVKCDRGEGVSCSQCRITRTNCEPILSRRGRHRKLPLNDLYTTSHKLTLPTVKVLPVAGDPNPTHAINEHARRREDCDVRLPDLESSSRVSLPAPRLTGRTSYVADSSNINYLIREFGHPDQNSTNVPPIEEYLHRAMMKKHIQNLRESTIGRLNSDGSFDLPPEDISTTLLSVFFQHAFPLIPIIDQEDFMKSIETGSVSHLLLNAIYMVATIYCPEPVIRETGFASRFIATLTFYNRAKDIYDFGYEKDAVSVIQATFLFAHWWSDPLAQKDPWYWLGITAGMAQSLAATAQALAKVVATDINLSMGLDRAPHVHHNFCEISSLTENDFEESSCPSSKDFLGGTECERRLFLINYIELTRTGIVPPRCNLVYYSDGSHLVAEIFTVEVCHPLQLSKGPSSSPNGFLQQISHWSTQVPFELRIESSNSVWAILTQITYKLIIKHFNSQYQLLFRRKSPDAAQKMGPGSEIFQICTRIYRMLEDLVTRSILSSVAIHVLPTVMSTLCFHIANIGRGEPQIRSISEHRARFCLRILKDLRASQPIIASVYPFFTSMFRRHSGVYFSESEKASAGNLHLIHRTDEIGTFTSDVASTLEEDACVWEELPHDDNSDVMNSAFPFSYLFEDAFLSPALDGSAM